MVDPDDLIDAGEVARILGLSQRNSVYTYQRRHPDMPPPLVVRDGGRIQLWHRPAIKDWATLRAGSR